MAGEEGNKETFAQNLNNALSAAGDSARARLASEPSQTPPSQPPPAPEQPSTSTEQPPPSEPQTIHKFSRGGRTFDLSPEDVDMLLNFAADSYEEAARQVQHQERPSETAEGPPAERPETKPTQPPGQQPESEILQKLKELKEKQDKLEQAQKDSAAKEAAKEQQAEIKRIMESVDRLFSENDVLKKVSANDDKKLAEQDTKITKAFISFLKGYSEETLEAASQKLTGLLERYGKQAVNHYIRNKIEQGGHRVEGSGGGVPVPGPKVFSGRDFLQGKVMDVAYERAAKALMSER